MPAPLDFMQKLERLAMRVTRVEQATRHSFANTGLNVPAPGVVQSDTYVPATSGFKLDGGNGIAEFKDVILYDLPNSMLANPVRGDSAYAYATGFALTTTGTTPLASQSWFTPAGFTNADVLIQARVFAYNPTGSLDYLYARSRVFIPSTGAEGYGIGLPLAVSASGGSGLNQSPVSIKVEGLADGQEIRLQVQGWTNGAGWAADAGNTADVAGQIIWTR